MKHLIIGDLHGRDAWEQADTAEYDRVIFLGDYTDSHYRPDFIIEDNLENIIVLKKRLPEKIILLLGNHDIQYLHYPLYPCPGFRPKSQPKLSRLFRDNRDCFQIAYQRHYHLFTHAGLTARWYQRFMKSAIVRQVQKPFDRIADILNKVEHTADRGILYAPSKLRTGEDSIAGPLWADWIETLVDPLEGYHQVVGHSPRPEMGYTGFEGKPNTSFTYLDVLHAQTYFHELNI